MAKKYLVSLDLSKNELLNARVQNLASAPSSPVSGQAYFDTTSDKLGIFNGVTWDYMGTGVATGDVSSNASSSIVDEIALFADTSGKLLKRATISGLAKLTSGVLSSATSGTDYYAPGSADVAVADGGTGASNASGARTNLGLVIGTDVLAPNGDGSNLTGLTQSQVTGLVSDLADKAPKASPTFTGSVTVPAPTAGTDATNKNYVDNAVQGLSWKEAVVVATIAAGALATDFEDGDGIDGTTLTTGDRILIKDQASGEENGIYIVNATGAPTRATDADTADKIKNMAVFVQQGSINGDKVFTLVTDNITLDTTALVYTQLGGGTVPSATYSSEGIVELATQAEAQAKSDTDRAVTPASLADFARKYTGTIGDGSSTSIAVTHGLGSQYVTAQAFEVSGNAQIECDVVLTSSTQTTFTFATAPASNAIRVVITG